MYCYEFLDYLSILPDSYSTIKYILANNQFSHLIKMEKQYPNYLLLLHANILGIVI
jgi:hypothetical protein